MEDVFNAKYIRCERAEANLEEIFLRLVDGTGSPLAKNKKKGK